ncbi:MAG: hypothetical protein Q8P12_04600 [bacterium]|nr:hypothetical protein [bacterium]
MRDQIVRTFLGTLFIALAVWAPTRGIGEAGIVPGILGFLLLVRALPLPVWKRWQEQFRPPRE